MRITKDTAKQLTNKFNPFCLYGSHNKHLRKSVLESITGKKVLMKDSGMTTLRETLFYILDPEGNCSALREKNAFIKLIEIANS